MRKITAIMLVLIMALSCVGIYAEEVPAEETAEQMAEVSEAEAAEDAPVAVEPVEAPVEAEPVEAEPVEAPAEAIPEAEAESAAEEISADKEILRCTLELPFGEQPVKAVFYGDTEDALQCMLSLSAGGNDIGDFGFRYDEEEDRFYMWASPLSETVIAVEGAEVEELLNMVLGFAGAFAADEDMLSNVDPIDVDMSPVFNALLDCVDISFEDVAEVAESDAQYAEGIGFASEAYNDAVFALDNGAYEYNFDMLDYNALEYIMSFTVSSEDILNVADALMQVIGETPVLDRFIGSDVRDFAMTLTEAAAQCLAQPIVCNVGFAEEMTPVYYDLFAVVGDDESGTTDFDFYVEKSDEAEMIVATVKTPGDEAPVVVLYELLDLENAALSADISTFDGGYLHYDLSASAPQLLEDDTMTFGLKASAFTFGEDAVTGTAEAELSAVLSALEGENSEGIALQFPLKVTVNEENLIDASAGFTLENTTEEMPVRADFENAMIVSLEEILNAFFTEPEGEAIE